MTNVEIETNDESSQPKINVWIDTNLEAVQKAKNTLGKIIFLNFKAEKTEISNESFLSGSRVLLIGNSFWEKVFIEVLDARTLNQTPIFFPFAPLNSIKNI